MSQNRAETTKLDSSAKIFSKMKKSSPIPIRSAEAAEKQSTDNGNPSCKLVEVGSVKAHSPVRRPRSDNNNSVDNSNPVVHGDKLRQRFINSIIKPKRVVEAKVVPHKPDEGNEGVFNFSL